MPSFPLTDDVLANLAATPIWDRIEACEWYSFAAETELHPVVTTAKQAVHQINQLAATDEMAATSALHEFLPGLAIDARVMFPIGMVEYPQRLTIGAKTFINAGLQVLSAGRVSIGANCFIGPDTKLYTPNHYVGDVTIRRQGWQYDAPITISDDVWFGGSVIVLPGVTIGSNVIVGAGSVVTKDVPNDVVVAGNPVKIIRHL